ncbi:MAG: hypothetical protein ACREVX_11590 [Clostridium sp.]|uniref:hypothetical protein n=1 Tax=Clostridium sp. TaxID=1506 RepID=UPI003D6CCE3A
MGYSTGKVKYSSPCPVYSKDLKRNNSYCNGFITAQKEYNIKKYKEDLVKLINESHDEGYNQAFDDVEPKLPERYNNHFIKYFKNINIYKNVKDDELISIKNSNNIDDEILIKSFKDGFHSNDEVTMIANNGYEDGLAFHKLKVVGKGQKFYTTQYNKGKTLSFNICIILVVASTGIYFFIRWKLKKRKLKI